MIDVSLMEEPKKKGSITYRRWALPFSMFDTNNKMARMRGNVNAGSKSAKRRVEEVYYKTLNESNVQACKTGKWFRVTELQPGQVEGVPSTDVAPSGLVASVLIPSPTKPIYIPAVSIVAHELLVSSAMSAKFGVFHVVLDHREPRRI